MQQENKNKNLVLLFVIDKGSTQNWVCKCFSLYTYKRCSIEHDLGMRYIEVNINLRLMMELFIVIFYSFWIYLGSSQYRGQWRDSIVFTLYSKLRLKFKNIYFFMSVLQLSFMIILVLIRQKNFFFVSIRKYHYTTIPYLNLINLIWFYLIGFDLISYTEFL